jgi:hypothetical protein
MTVVTTPLLLFKTWQHFPTPSHFGPPTTALGDEESDSNSTCIVTDSDDESMGGIPVRRPLGVLDVVTNPSQLSANDPTISHLRDQLSAAVDQVQHQEDLLSASQADLLEKDLLISSLSEERNEYRTLCSAYEGRLGKKEGEILKLTAKLARLDAQVGSLARKKAVCNKAKPVTKFGAVRGEVNVIPQIDSGDGNSSASSGKQGFKERQASSSPTGDSRSRSHSVKRKMRPETSLPSTQLDTTVKQDATIDRLTTKLAEQASQILILTQEFEKLEQTRANLEKTINENEESMARLRINVAKERDAANQWKAHFSLARGHPNIYGTSDSSMIGIFDAHNRRIAELEEKLSECYGQLVASLSRKDGEILLHCQFLLDPLPCHRFDEKPSATF